MPLPRSSLLTTSFWSAFARLGLAITAALLVLPAATAEAVTAAAPRVLFRLSDNRIDEASGIGVGLRSPTAIYVQNDSGDAARFFAIDAHTGRTRAVYDVPGATNVDWEDLAVAPDAAGTPSIWLADVGDNAADRPSVTIYRVSEPAVGTGGGTLRTGRPQIWRLRYPTGPVNTESLAVAPDGAAYLFTKSQVGATAVYAVPRSARGGAVQQLRRIGSIQFPVPAGVNPVLVIGQLTATGAALSRDGRLLVVRTYSDAYFWAVSNGDVAAAVTRKPIRVALPPQPQGEGITFAGRYVLLDSEGVGTAVYAVPIPAELGGPGTASGSAAAASGSAASGSAAAASGRTTATAAEASAVGSATSQPSRRDASTGSRVVSIGALVLIFGAAWALTRTMRRRRRARQEGRPHEPSAERPPD